MRTSALPLRSERVGSAQEIYDAFWKFAVDRQAVYFRRLRGDPAPWTDDPILSQYRFTNAYRASDRVSQYLIRNVIYKGSAEPDEVVFRVLLFKLFNKIETWEMLQERLGELTYKKYRRENYSRPLGEATKAGAAIYSAAYIMAPPTGPYKGQRKYEAHLRLIEAMMKDGLPKRLAQAKNLEACFRLLATYPMVGDFLGFQLAIDLNYSEFLKFDEMEFVVAGPGAKSGITKCFGPVASDSYASVIRRVTENQEKEFASRGLKFQDLFGRRLQLIDVQNLFCEIDKYSRAAFPWSQGIGDRSRIKRKFAPLGALPLCFFPPKWNLRVPVGPTMQELSVANQSDLSGELNMRSERTYGRHGAKTTDIRVELDQLQQEQAKHDQICHQDICALSTQDKLKHFVLHYAKYVGALAAVEGVAGEEAKAKALRAVIDSFIISLAAANALGMRISAHSQSANDAQKTLGLFQQIAIATGKMAKACEALDHLERYDFRGQLELGVLDVTTAILRHLPLPEREFWELVVARWREIEARSKK